MTEQPQIPDDENRDPDIIPFRIPRSDNDSRDDDPNRRYTLREYYEQKILPEISQQSPRSHQHDRSALNKWERHTDNPEIRDISRFHLEQLRDGMLAEGVRESTVNSKWRELRMMLGFAKEYGLIFKVPFIAYGMKSKLVRETRLPQREIITEEEVTKLWDACKFATYPQRSPTSPTKAWRVAIVLFWMYGPRTLDLFNLRWENVRLKDRVIQFEAMKTRKIQGLPLTNLVLLHLHSLESYLGRIFHGFNSPGKTFENGKGQTIHYAGYYDTWNNEIVANAGISNPIQFKNFRQTMVTNYNGDETVSGLGNWIAGHYMPGVSAQSYDMPTRRIRKAIDSAHVPDCFFDIQK